MPIQRPHGKREEERLARIDAVLKHLRQLAKDADRMIGSLEKERDRSRSTRIIESLQKSRDRINARSRKAPKKRR